MAAEPVPVSLMVNGRQERGFTEPRTTLADFLRGDLGLTGTHVGCEQGVCGACTVIVDGAAVRSCLMFAVQAEGAAVTTVEGLADGSGQEDELHPLQRAFWETQGLQCGFCTPGILMAALAALDEDPGLDRERLRERIAGNVCRCTGYQTVLDAVAAAAAELRAGVTAEVPG